MIDMQAMVRDILTVNERLGEPEEEEKEEA